MPVRDGRWVSPAKIAEEQAAAKAAAALAAEQDDLPADEVEDATTGKRVTDEAALAAISEATGVVFEDDSDDDGDSEDTE